MVSVTTYAAISLDVHTRHVRPQPGHARHVRPQPGQARHVRPQPGHARRIHLRLSCWRTTWRIVHPLDNWVDFDSDND